MAAFPQHPLTPRSLSKQPLNYSTMESLSHVLLYNASHVTIQVIIVPFVLMYKAALTPFPLYCEASPRAP